MFGSVSRVVKLFVLAGVGFGLAGPAHGTLIHQYIFNGNADDQVSGGVNGTLVGDATAVGGVLSLDGSGAWVNFGSNFLVPTSGNYSVMLFAKYTYDGSVHEFISQGNSGGPGFYIGPYGNEMRVTDNYGWIATPAFSGSCGGACTGVEAPSDGNWHHYALVVTGSSAEFLVDGILRATRSGFSIGGASPTVLGSQFGGNWELFNGLMKDVRIYDDALTNSEVAQIATGSSEAPEPGSAMLVAAALLGARLLARRSK
jgi:Concanavalin A-like lectin/glucanases superfamily